MLSRQDVFCQVVGFNCIFDFENGVYPFIIEAEYNLGDRIEEHLCSYQLRMVGVRVLAEVVSPI